jgi:hypothetical protein
MFKSLLGKISNVAVKTFGSIKEPLKKVGQFAVQAGKFALDNHQYIAPLLHGVALASGNQMAQKVTSGLVSVSQMATLRQGLNRQNNKIQSEMSKGGTGIFDATKGRMTSYA